MGLGRGSALALVAALVLAGGTTAEEVADAAGSGDGPQAWADACDEKALPRSTLALAPALSRSAKGGPDLDPEGKEIRIRPDGRGKYVPVVFIHGLTDRSTHSDDRGGTFSSFIDLVPGADGGGGLKRSLVGLIQDVPGAAVFTFDYRRDAAKWVESDPIGPALARSIDCLAEQSGEKVIVLAHSMGGLATRFATGQDRGNGSLVGEAISTVVTFGTPNTGSDIAAEISAGLENADNDKPVDLGDINSVAANLAGALRLIMSGCGRAATVDTEIACTEWRALLGALGSEAGIALRAGSDELDRLRRWPSNIDVVALAGQSILELHEDPGWFFWEAPKVTEIDLGDGIVSVDSALSGSAEDETLTCRFEFDVKRSLDDQIVDTIVDVKLPDGTRRPWHLASDACFHTNLMRSIRLATVARDAIRDDIAARDVVISTGGLGPLRLGMLESRLGATGLLTQTECFGEPIWRPTEDNDVLWDLDVKDGVLDTLTVQGEKTTAHTAEGIRIGSTLAELRAAYGDRLVLRPPPGPGNISEVYGLLDDTGELWLEVAEGAVIVMTASLGIAPGVQLHYYETDGLARCYG